MNEGWEIKKLGDLFDITSSKRVFKADWKDEGVPFYRAREIVRLARDGFVDNELFITPEMYDDYCDRYGTPQEGDIMVTGVGTLGICYVVKANDRFYFKDGNIIWLKKKSDADSRYVEYAFQSPFLRKQIDNSVGATVGTYTIIKAKNTAIPIPKVAEQKRIVAILDEAFGAIDRAKEIATQNVANARELFESYLNRVFTEKGEGWEEKTLGEVCAFENGDRGKNYPSKKVLTDSGYPFVNAGNLKDGRIDRTSLLCVPEERFRLLSRGKFEDGDILFCLRGSLGKFALVDEIGCGAIASSLVIIRPKPELHSAYFLHYLASRQCAAMVDAFEGGAAQPNLSAKDLAAFEISMPSILDQEQLANALDQKSRRCDTLRQTYERTIIALDELKQSILQKAFTGQLTANSPELEAVP